MSSPSWFFYETGFLTQTPTTDGDVPPYLCTYTDGITPETDICTKEQICAGNDQIATWEENPDNSGTLYNWVQRLDLTCVDDWKVGMIGAGFFIGWCCTLLWLPSFGDSGGRRKYFYLGQLIDLALYTGIYLE